jgi:transcriptional regulator with XRE-family HTH domain
MLIRQRLDELGLDQRDLAAAIEVTDSYVSQLLARKKPPPAPARTDIYERMARFLELPAGELARLAEVQRRHELQRRVAEPPHPLFRECRELILRKCEAERRAEIRAIFEREAFGELERLVAQTALEVAQRLAREELRSEAWLRSLAQLSGRSFEEMRVAVLEFLDTDVFQISLESCVSFLDPMLDWWDIDLRSFGMEFVLNQRLAPGGLKRLEFVEVTPEPPTPVDPGLEAFLRDPVLRGKATEEEIAFLQALPLRGRRATPLYYYRELQNLRDPLHFVSSTPA